MPSAHAGHIASLGRAHAVFPVDAHGVTAALLGGPLWGGGLPCGVTLPQGQPRSAIRIRCWMRVHSGEASSLGGRAIGAHSNLCMGALNMLGYESAAELSP